MHRLDVPRAPGQYRHRLRGHCQRSSLAGVRQVSDHDGRLLLYDVDDRVELDRVGQVVDEVDEKAEAREEQQDCAGDREPRKLLDAAAAGYADCVKPRRTVAKVATNTLSTIWLGRSRRKLPSSRGEYWPEATCSATTVRPSTTATTEIIVPAVPMSSVRASSGVPWKTSLYSNPSRGTGTNESTEPGDPRREHSDPRQHPQRRADVLADLLTPPPAACEPEHPISRMAR